MPIDKHPTSNTQKPFTPALSSSFRNVKSPLTPKLAGSAPTSPAIASRRDPFVRAFSPGLETSSTTPINENITPRSGIRKTRIGTESPSTPGSNRETTGTRPRAITSGASAKPLTPQQQGLGITSPQRAVASPNTQPISSAVSSTLAYTVHRRLSGAKSAVDGKEELSSKFFRADDAKAVTGSPAAIDRPVQSIESSSFFYVGNQKAQDGQSSAAASSSDIRHERDDKFFHAQDMVVQPSSKPGGRPVLQANRSFALASSSRPQPLDGYRRQGAHTRSPSPNKSRRLIATEPSSPKKESQETVPTSNAAPRSVPERRKSISSNSSSVKMAPQPGHRKSISAGSVQNTPIRKLSIVQPSVSSQPESSPHPPSKLILDTLERASAPLLSPDASSSRSFSLTSSNTVTTSMTSDTDQSEIPRRLKSSIGETNGPASSQLSEPMLHRQSTSQSLSFQPDEAANARRERKVLDLEISNSSLLAINKTLEKELRKQNSELRRFRRLSRSGRLSLAPTERTASGSTLGTVAEMHDEDDDNSDLDEDSDLDNVDDEDESILSNDSNSMLSLTGKSQQRIRDEKRLMLDLSKHQQLLIDSQKLSQSIRRCLTCTEELIRDGNKALEYRVGIGDIKLGGRVLSHDELEDQAIENGETEANRGHQALLSPSLKSTALMEADRWFDTALEKSPSHDLVDLGLE